VFTAIIRQHAQDAQDARTDLETMISDQLEQIDQVYNDTIAAARSVRDFTISSICKGNRTCIQGANAAYGIAENAAGGVATGLRTKAFAQRLAGELAINETFVAKVDEAVAWALGRCSNFYD